ncbi:MAG TPA: transposase, partial [Dissulfurispiraceae bacterium]|nr:transposase [Dissulfurispiraceae bacterium]
LLYEACKVNRWYISEISIQEEHVHVVIQIPPKVSVAEAVQTLKGGTSRVSGTGRVSVGR